MSLGRARDAWAAIAPHLEGRPERPAWGIDDPEALHDVAGAAVLSGDVARGHELYRWLVARAALLSDSRERARALVEAGAAALARGAEFVSEAELYLDEARRASTPGVDALALAFQALALDRAGQPEHARALAREIADPWALERLLSERERAAVTSQIFGATEGAPVAPPPEPEGRPVFFLPSGELHAAIGVVMAGRDPKLAELHFRAFLADQRAGAGPWVEHAKKKLSLRSSARRREE